MTRYLNGASVRAVVGYCVTHRKQLATAFAFGAGVVEAVQRAH